MCIYIYKYMCVYTHIYIHSAELNPLLTNKW